MSEVALLIDAKAEVGEGPVWDDQSGELLWVDITSRRLHRYRLAAGTSEFMNLPGSVGAIALREAGGYILALEDGFWMLDKWGDPPRRLVSVEAEITANRMNDGKCDRSGRFWAGTMALDSSRGAGSLYRLDRDGKVVKMLNEITISNGIAWSSDDNACYFVDSATGGIDVFDYAASSGTITNRRTLIREAPESGLPDGMTVDAQGYLWVAFWGGWSIRRYSPEGQLDKVVRLPVSQVSSCTFGGAGFSQLYVTSARTGLSDDELRRQPSAGGIFICNPGVVGLPANRFAG
jgi:sugar lactone lactonase YvrE